MTTTKTSLSQFIKNTTRLFEANEILFYGGSFNPWHDGHTSCIKLSPLEMPLIVLPDNNPHKKMNKIKNLDLVKLESHLKTLRKDIWIYENLYLENKLTPTIDWLQEIHKNYPDKRLSLLLGHDSFINLHTWKKAHDLLQTLSSLYIVSRLDNELDTKNAIDQYKNINSQLEIFFQGHHEFEHLSSTELR